MWNAERMDDMSSSECHHSDCSKEARGLKNAENRIAAAFCSDEHEIADELASRDDEYDIQASSEREDGRVVCIPVSAQTHQRVRDLHSSTGYLVTDLYGMALREGLADLERWVEQFSENPKLNRVAEFPVLSDTRRGATNDQSNESGKDE